MVQRVRSVDSKIEIQSIAGAEGTADGAIQQKLTRPCDGIPARISPVARSGRDVSGRVQRETRWSGVKRRARVVGPDAPGNARAAHRREIIGVSGSPLPAVICVPTVHSFKAPAFQPLSRVPPPS